MTETTEQPTKTTGTVDALLNQVAQGTEFHFQSGLCGDWTLMAEEPEKAALHLITEGNCWFGFPSSQAAVTELHAGDIIFVNQGISHFLSDQPIPTPISESDIPNFCQPEHQQNGVVCYDINSPSQTTDAVFRLLPPWVILNQEHQANEMRALIKMIRVETKAGQPGSQAIVQRLSDVLAIHLLRAVITSHQELKGPLAALQDRHLKTLVLTIIDEPGGDWSVETMAEKVYLSPSAFADRCQKQTGMAPKKLVDQLRLQRARMLLTNTTLSLELIAEQLGYQSATAFSRFFKRYQGVSASHFRNDD
ncbi:AraC family transcriptional regulator [Idiomarina piscisalsi]|uniref:AraC family transcriptional regulator n=1 Tax=Idiomarina piscisalsi TaxID=1096243 RepID=UPI00138152B2|nr:AraC family transcriptional regulator [Idiomarina piscisalsi]MTJ00988.1 AraC family transcriptional regulator [Idiomarina piscisalsi]